MSKSDGAELAERLHHLEALLDLAGVDAADDRHGAVVHRLRHLGVGGERDRHDHRRDLVRAPARRSRASRASPRPTSSTGYKVAANATIGPTGFRSNVNDVTMPKLPPPPRIAQKRSAFESLGRRQHLAVGAHDLGLHQVVAESPYLRRSQP